MAEAADAIAHLRLERVVLALGAHGRHVRLKDRLARVHAHLHTPDKCMSANTRQTAQTGGGRRPHRWRILIGQCLEVHPAICAVRVPLLDARSAVGAVGLAGRGVDWLARGEDGEDELRDLRLARLADD